MLLSVLALLSVAQTGAPLELNLSKDLRLPLLVVSPSGAGTRVSLSDIDGAFAEAIAASTPLRLELLDLGVSDCAMRFGCMFGRIIDAGTLHAEHGLLLFVSHQAFPGHEDRLAARLVDLKQTAALLSEGADEIALTSQIFLAKPEAGLVGDKSALLEVAKKTVAALEPALRAKKLWGPTGEVLLELSTGPAQIFLDAQPVGLAGPGAVRLRGITAEPHALRVERERFEPLSTTLEVSASAELSLEVSLVPLRRGILERPSLGTWIGGASASAAGIAFLILAAASTNQNGLHCGVGSASASCSQGPLRLIAPGSDAGASAQGSGPLVGALGYSLILAGGSALGTEMIFDSDELPWWLGPLVGVVVGGLSYGLSEALISGPGT
ncbi:MAG: hypothetical protein U1E65_35200 [Myxococcota bacterium]